MGKMGMGTYVRRRRKVSLGKKKLVGTKIPSPTKVKAAAAAVAQVETAKEVEELVKLKKQKMSSSSSDVENPLDFISTDMDEEDNVEVEAKVPKSNSPKLKLALSSPSPAVSIDKLSELTHPRTRSSNDNNNLNNANSTINEPVPCCSSSLINNYYTSSSRCSSNSGEESTTSGFSSGKSSTTTTNDVNDYSAHITETESTIKLPGDILRKMVKDYCSKTLQVNLKQVDPFNMPGSWKRSRIQDENDPNFTRPVIGRNTGERHLVVLPSEIQGHGLFTKHKLKKGEMIIEYRGELITRKVALRRQTWYGYRKIDNYVMEIGKDIHIDATFDGNCARFINHSCAPNCTAEIARIRKVVHVLVVAQRDIEADEELCYDYQFNADELIPCNCQAKNCRKFLNYNIGRLRLKPDELQNLVEEQRQRL